MKWELIVRSLFPGVSYKSDSCDQSRGGSAVLLRWHGMGCNVSVDAAVREQVWVRLSVLRNISFWVCYTPPSASHIYIFFYPYSFSFIQENPKSVEEGLTLLCVAFKDFRSSRPARRVIMCEDTSPDKHYSVDHIATKARTCRTAPFRLITYSIERSITCNVVHDFFLTPLFILSSCSTSLLGDSHQIDIVHIHTSAYTYLLTHHAAAAAATLNGVIQSEERKLDVPDDY